MKRLEVPFGLGTNVCAELVREHDDSGAVATCTGQVQERLEAATFLVTDVDRGDSALQNAVGAGVR